MKERNAGDIIPSLGLFLQLTCNQEMESHRVVDRVETSPSEALQEFCAPLRIFSVF